MKYEAGDIIETSKFRWVLESPKHDSGRWSAYRLRRRSYGWQGEAIDAVDVFPDLMLLNKGFSYLPRHKATLLRN